MVRQRTGRHHGRQYAPVRRATRSTHEPRSAIEEPPRSDPTIAEVGQNASRAPRCSLRLLVSSRKRSRCISRRDEQSVNRGFRHPPEPEPTVHMSRDQTRTTPSAAAGQRREHRGRRAAGDARRVDGATPRGCAVEKSRSRPRPMRLCSADRGCRVGGNSVPWIPHTPNVDRSHPKPIAPPRSRMRRATRLLFAALVLLVTFPVGVLSPPAAVEPGAPPLTDQVAADLFAGPLVAVLISIFRMSSLADTSPAPDHPSPRSRCRSEFPMVARAPPRPRSACSRCSVVHASSRHRRRCPSC
jgi:hypothetical protein